MAWEERTVKEMREEFVRRVLAREKSKAALCREENLEFLWIVLSFQVLHYLQH